MLAGCSSTLLSPSHRLRSEASAMSTQRLDLPCGFARKDGTRSQPVRPIGIAVEKPIEGKTGGCSLKQNIKLPPTPTEGRRENRDDFWEKSKKRYAGEVSYDEDSYGSRSKRKRATKKAEEAEEEEEGEEEERPFWFHPGGGLHTPQVPFSLSCSGEEKQRVCFMPASITAPPLPPLSNIPWFDSVVTEITGLGKNNGGGPAIKCPDREPSSGSSSSTSDGSRDLFLGPSRNNTVEPEVDPPNPVGSIETLVPAGHHNNGGNGNNRNRTEEQECAELVNLLVACAEQIGSKNIAATNHCLSRLGEIASPRGSPLHRLVAYFTEALALRAARLWPHIFHVTAPRELDRATDDETNTAFRVLNQVSPIPKFIHFTSNEILLRAFEGKDRVHIIDFDVKQGLQWPSLFQSLASRTNPPSHVRITGIGESKQELIETGDRLSGFAESLGLPFEFHPVVDRLEDVRLWMLHVKGGTEAVAVNCVFQLHKLLYDSTGRVMRDFLGLIRSTNAGTVVLAEQEASHDEAGLDARLCSSLRYYCAVFDSVGYSGLPLESLVRMKVEEMFGREIRNIIACEGRDRVERHRVFSRWREVMEAGGFRCLGTGERELVQVEMMLKMYSCESYRVGKREGNGCLTLSWLDQPLYTVSAWTSFENEAAGSFSSYSQTI